MRSTGLGRARACPPERRALITDYLLGQLPEKVADDTHRGLAESANERAWARVVASELGTLAAGPLPEIPTDSAGARAPSAEARRSRTHRSRTLAAEPSRPKPPQPNPGADRIAAEPITADPVAAEPAAAEPQPRSPDPAPPNPRLPNPAPEHPLPEHPGRPVEDGSAAAARPTAPLRRGPAIRSHGGTARSCSAARRW